MPFESFDKTKDLRLKFRLPKLRKDRIIPDRDVFGKTVMSKVTARRVFR